MIELNHLETQFGHIEPDVLAFLPEPGRFERLRRDAAALDALYPDPASRPRLFGQTLGIKDIFHVDGYITRAGTTVPPEEFAGDEGPVVRALREAGVLIMGKTVTTEFAYFAPGPTRHPLSAALREIRTPGGSSSGSAAAVAARLCRLALGTQTIGSVIRPAAFCGVVGYKPSFGRVPIDGVVPLSPSADTVGWFARGIDDAAALTEVLLPGLVIPAPPRQLRLGIPEGPYLARASAEGLAGFRATCDDLRAAGHTLVSVPIMDDFEAIDARHRLLVAAEAAQTHARWYALYGERYHPKTVELIRRGRGVRPDELATALAGGVALRAELQATMDAHGLDAWIAPAAVGPALPTLDSTGDPVMALPWHHAGLPAISLPAGHVDGWPLGLQIIGRFGADGEVLAAAAAAEQAIWDAVVLRQSAAAGRPPRPPIDGSFRPLFADTSPEAEAVLIELSRQMPSWRKAEIVGEMNRAVRMMMMSGLRQRHPNADEDELRRRLADLLFGPELAAKAFGPFPAEKKEDDA